MRVSSRRTVSLPSCTEWISIIPTRSNLKKYCISYKEYDILVLGLLQQLKNSSGMSQVRVLPIFSEIVVQW
jgi:hypothetical protein